MGPIEIAGLLVVGLLTLTGVRRRRAAREIPEIPHETTVAPPLRQPARTRKILARITLSSGRAVDPHEPMP